MIKQESSEKKPKVVTGQYNLHKKSVSVGQDRNFIDPRYEKKQPMDFTAKNKSGQQEKIQVAPRPKFHRARTPAKSSEEFDTMMSRFIDPEARAQYKYLELRNETEEKYHECHDKEQKRLVRSVAKRKRKIDKLTEE